MARGMPGRAMTQFRRTRRLPFMVRELLPHGFYFMEACDVSEEGCNPSPGEV